MSAEESGYLLWRPDFLAYKTHLRKGQHKIRSASLSAMSWDQRQPRILEQVVYIVLVEEKLRQGLDFNQFLNIPSFASQKALNASFSGIIKLHKAQSFMSHIYDDKFSLRIKPSKWCFHVHDKRFSHGEDFFMRCSKFSSFNALGRELLDPVWELWDGGQCKTYSCSCYHIYCKGLWVERVYCLNAYLCPFHAACPPHWLPYSFWEDRPLQSGCSSLWYL